MTSGDHHHELANVRPVADPDASVVLALAELDALPLAQRDRAARHVADAARDKGLPQSDAELAQRVRAAIARVRYDDARGGADTNAAEVTRGEATHRVLLLAALVGAAAGAAVAVALVAVWAMHHLAAVLGEAATQLARFGLALVGVGAVAYVAIAVASGGRKGGGRGCAGC